MPTRCVRAKCAARPAREQPVPAALGARVVAFRRCVKGDAYAVVAQPYSAVAQVLQGTGRLCDILILHVDIKNCRARRVGSENTLSVVIGSQVEQSPEGRPPTRFHHRVLSAIRIISQWCSMRRRGRWARRITASCSKPSRATRRAAFLHLSYSYAQRRGGADRDTGIPRHAGRDKVGFSIVGRKPDGAPVYIGNERGMIERNTMRYYLAIEAYLRRDAPEASVREASERMVYGDRALPAPVARNGSRRIPGDEAKGGGSAASHCQHQLRSVMGDG